VRSDWPMQTRRKCSQLQIVALNTSEFGGPPAIFFGDMSPGPYANDLVLFEHVPISHAYVRPSPDPSCCASANCPLPLTQHSPGWPSRESQEDRLVRYAPS
jgi:hypothetical protein